MLKYKICVAGSKGVGKSSLITRYVHDVFNEKSIQTIDKNYTSFININNQSDLERINLAS